MKERSERGLERRSGRHTRRRVGSALLAASLIGLGACASTGDHQRLEQRVSQLEGRVSTLEQRVADAERTADQAAQSADRAAADARASAGRADDAARRAEAIFRKGISK